VGNDIAIKIRSKCSALDFGRLTGTSEDTRLVKDKSRIAQGLRYGLQTLLISEQISIRRDRTLLGGGSGLPIKDATRNRGRIGYGTHGGAQKTCIWRFCVSIH